MRKGNKTILSPLLVREPGPQNQLLFNTGLSVEQRQWKTSHQNPDCPLSKFVGNDKAKRRLSRAAYQMWGRENHAGGDQQFSLIGGSSAGKTTLARLFGQTTLLPYVEIQPKAVQNALDIVEAFADVLDRVAYEQSGGDPITLRLNPDENRVFVIPPTVALIDEVHALPNPVVQALLKATEPKDGMLSLGDGWTADCRRVCWIIATTDRGLLFDAFDTRFRKIYLNLYGRDEIAEIVRRANPDWDMSVCKLVAKYCWRVPREALAFAVDMRAEYELQSHKGAVSWEQVAAAVARDNDIDPYGMTRQRITVLAALGQQGAIPRSRLILYAGCKEEELIHYLMPPLLTATENEPALVAVTSQGYSLTMAGIDELNKRGIPNLGEDAVKIDIPALDFGNYDPDDFEVKAA